MCVCVCVSVRASRPQLWFVYELSAAWSYLADLDIAADPETPIIGGCPLPTPLLSTCLHDPRNHTAYSQPLALPGRARCILVSFSLLSIGSESLDQHERFPREATLNVLGVLDSPQSRHFIIKPENTWACTIKKCSNVTNLEINPKQWGQPRQNVVNYRLYLKSTIF